LEISTDQDRRFMASGVVLGVALSGFFDGILLHQILQWHHLLSLVPGATYQDPRVQIAADGVFHALMYGLAVLGLVMLWTGPDRRRSGHPALWRSVALGFGGWNLLDVVLFHWILEWHHVRLDTAMPIAWDLLWVVVFGLAPAAAALAPGRRGGDRARRGTGVFLAVLVIGGAIWASGPSKSQATIVLFGPDATASQVMKAIASADARLISTDASGQLVVVALPSNSAGWDFYRNGALLVSSAAPAGCAAWTTLPERR
jgi:uncharacterized membrane protein